MTHPVDATTVYTSIKLLILPKTQFFVLCDSFYSWSNLTLITDKNVTVQLLHKQFHEDSEF